jgi:hypothetical protein
MLDNPLTTCPIVKGREMSIELYLNWQFRYLDNPNRVFRDSLVPTQTQTRCSSQEPLLTLSVLRDYKLTTIEYIPQWSESLS